jgi:hypothetical protein
MMMDYDVESTTSSESDFLSPPVRHKVPGREEKLPMSHDNSWLGARLSPIAFDDNDDDERVIRPYREALSESVLTERSALLAKVKPKDRSKIHPLWDDGNSFLVQSMQARDKAQGYFNWGNVVWVISGMHLLAIFIHDMYLWYLSIRQGYEVDVERWSIPWLSPSKIVLTRFGGFVPYRVLVYGEWWRLFSSVFISTSVTEWLLVVGSWQTLKAGGARPTRKWCYLYILSVFTGQLWTMAFDITGVAGGAAWGTSGVICAAGGAKPRQRFVLFMLAIAMILLSLVEPTNSVMGTIGSSFFGWSFFGLGWSRVVSKFDKDTVKPKGAARLLSFMALVKLWVIPLMFVAFRDPSIAVMML